jgi:aspartate-semialdehyde dehydrogenase
MRSHSIATTVVTEKKLDLGEVKAAIKAFPGVQLAEDIDGRDYPTPLDTSDQNDVFVGRIRQDLTNENGICLWCCGDQIRKGAAANAVQILKLLVDKK